MFARSFGNWKRRIGFRAEAHGLRAFGASEGFGDLRRYGTAFDFFLRGALLSGIRIGPAPGLGSAGFRRPWYAGPAPNLSPRVRAQFHKRQPAAFAGFVHPGHFGMSLDRVSLPGQFEFQKERLLRAHRDNALETQPAFADVDEDGSVIRAEIHINQALEPAARVGPAFGLRRR